MMLQQDDQAPVADYQPHWSLHSGKSCGVPVTATFHCIGAAAVYSNVSDQQSLVTIHIYPGSNLVQQNTLPMQRKRVHLRFAG